MNKHLSTSRPHLDGHILRPHLPTDSVHLQPVNIEPLNLIIVGVLVGGVDKVTPTTGHWNVNQIIQRQLIAGIVRSKGAKGVLQLVNMRSERLLNRPKGARLSAGNSKKDALIEGAHFGPLEGGPNVHRGLLLRQLDVDESNGD
ncbi:hypothetical protein TYRP_020215 [Tyrophagus putrescentiae]|nr:hypothetical protein TYRP_020215 [Tyrophagus putrescentiae]